MTDTLPGEPACPEDDTVLRVDGDGWVCGWCGHREPFDDVTSPASASREMPGIHGG